MEDLEQPEEASVPPPEMPTPRLAITPEIRGYWLETANWALIFALLTIIYLVVSSIDTIGKMNALSGLEMTPGIGIVYIIIGIIFVTLTFIPVWFYYKFATLVKRGLQKETNSDIEAGFSFLKYHYVFYGVLAILYLVFIIMMFIIGVVLASKASSF
jgi:hypothetical protein